MKYNSATGQLEQSPLKGRDGSPGRDGRPGFMGPKGDKGERGDDGKDGQNGKDGLDGRDGESIIGPQGPAGKDGMDGAPGKNGKDGNKIHSIEQSPDPKLGISGDIAINQFKEYFIKDGNKWSFKGTLGGGGGGIALRLRSLEGIGNVKLGSLTVGDNLQWNGSYWTNSTEDSLANLNVQLDKVDASVTYIGYAAAGSADSAASWKIKKITTTGDDLTITWADGNILFDNIWDNRASLTYS